jgi:hypothetical protein
MWYQMKPARASVIVRCSQIDAARIRKEASREHRSLSGYLLHVLERSFFIEDKVPEPALVRQGWFLRIQADENIRTAIHLRCTAEQAARIRRYAARRELSLSDFVMFSLRRLWEASDRLR